MATEPEPTAAARPEFTAAARPESTSATAGPEPEPTAAARSEPEPTAAARWVPEFTAPSPRTTATPQTTASPPTAASPQTAASPPTAASPHTAAAPQTSGSPPTTGSPTTAGSSGRTRSSRRGRTTRTVRGIGAGLVEVPEVPVGNPAGALLTDPKVPERNRFCTACGAKVGRSTDGHPGATEGDCPRCGVRFSFVPALPPGTLVAGQYDVQGALAHGGNGWIYLAIDRNVENRWVVLKGLIHTNNPEARAAAIAERRFLARLDHPNIVNIHNFVEHPGSDGVSAGYIVMEYVGGRSLHQLLDDRRRPGRTIDPLPVDRTIALGLEILPAFAYLHSQGLAYCDFKPDNAIQYGRRLKLIDLGAVIRMDDRHSPLFGTVGYQDPEIAERGPSVESDIFTVGRTLAVLALGMRPNNGGELAPIPEDHPILLAHPSFARVLRRATDPNPFRRFASADEMGDQLEHVLRETLALSSGTPQPRPSIVFGPGRGWFATDLPFDGTATARPDPVRIARTLPIPLVDLSDPGAALLATAVGATADDVAEMIATVGRMTPELGFARARALLTAGDPAAADAVLDEMAADDPDDWRVPWHRGLVALSSGDAVAAVSAFDECYTALPGESVVKLALAAAAECAETDRSAGRYYAIVAQTDPAAADAAFGWARTLLRSGDRKGAIRALDLVPGSSSQHVAAQLGAIRTELADPDARDRATLDRAADRAAHLPLDAATGQQVRAELLEAAIPLADAPTASGDAFVGVPWTSRDLRFALEHSLRASARLTTDPDSRYALVDRANDIRPRTWT